MVLIIIEKFVIYLILIIQHSFNYICYSLAIFDLKQEFLFTLLPELIRIQEPLGLFMINFNKITEFPFSKGLEIIYRMWELIIRINENLHNFWIFQMQWWII